MPGMAHSLYDLLNLTDDEVVRRHDDQAKTTVVGTQYYLDELNRRYQKRQTEAMLRLTKCSVDMMFVITFAALVNLGIAVGLLVTAVK